MEAVLQWCLGQCPSAWVLVLQVLFAGARVDLVPPTRLSGRPIPESVYCLILDTRSPFVT